MENGNKVSKEDVITKLKDDGDFDRLRLKIIRRLKDNEELRNSIISIVKQSPALNRPGAENMKPRELSDAIYAEIKNQVMSPISDSLWGIIRSPDGMNGEISKTVQSVYDNLSNQNQKTMDDLSTARTTVHKVGDGGPLSGSSGEIYDRAADGEPKEPPGFSLSSNHGGSEHRLNEEAARPKFREKLPSEDLKDGPQKQYDALAPYDADPSSDEDPPLPLVLPDKFVAGMARRKAKLLRPNHLQQWWATNLLAADETC